MTPALGPTAAAGRGDSPRPLRRPGPIRGGAVTAEGATRTRSRSPSPPGSWPARSRSWRSADGKCTRRRRAEPSRRSTGIRAASSSHAPERAEFRRPTLRVRPFASGQFHVLLNSLFKVLFNLPSRYLSAIGLAPVFSLRWSLPPALGCIPKQPDSWDARGRARRRQQRPYTRRGRSLDQEDFGARPRDWWRPAHHSSRRPQDRGIRCWAYPASLAVTEGILVSFFSSA